MHGSTVYLILRIDLKKLLYNFIISHTYTVGTVPITQIDILFFRPTELILYFLDPPIVFGHQLA